MRQELVRLLDSDAGRRTVVMVTHDIEEAAQLADRIVLLSGRPASISCELKVEAPQPRSLTHPAVVEATRRIIAELGLEDVAPV
jgi:NitT/TauT family transport system ATP-binding protein